MEIQSKETNFFFLMLLITFTLIGCNNINDEVIEEPKFEVNIETLGEFENDQEFEELMKMCEIPKNPKTNELEKEIISFSNDELVLINSGNVVYLAFIFENDVFKKNRNIFQLRNT